MMRTYKFAVYAQTKIGRQRMASDFITEADNEKEAREKAISFYKLQSNYQFHTFELLNPPSSASPGI